MIKEATMVSKGDTFCKSINVSKIKNGSKFVVGGELSRVELTLHQHFNWFQKLMWAWCFGVKIEDYREE